MLARGVIRDSSSLWVSSSSISIKPSFVFYVEEQSCLVPETDISLRTSSQGLFIEGKMLSISGLASDKDFSIISFSIITFSLFSFSSLSFLLFSYLSLFFFLFFLFDKSL